MGPSFLMLIPAILLAIYASTKVRSSYRKWAAVRTQQAITGAEVAKNIMDTSGISNVRIEHVTGTLTDNYNPINHTLNLSEGVYNGDSVAALGIAAYEAGHAIQHKKGYTALAFRNGIFPIARFGSFLAFPLLIIGMLFYKPGLINLGILLYAGFVIFTVITLPVEFNASKRAVKILKNGNYLTSHELNGAKEVLNAAALTYVASAAMAISQLLRLLSLKR